MTKMIHRLWLGPRPMPDLYRDFGEQLTLLNPGYELHDWSLDDLPFRPANLHVISDIRRRDAGRNGIECWVQIADVLSYELVYELGGIYLNTDIQPVQSFDYMEGHYATFQSPWVASEDETYVVGAAMGATRPHDRFFKTVINSLADRYFNDPSAEMVFTTGPRLLTDCFNATHGALALPPAAFNYRHWRDVSRNGPMLPWDVTDLDPGVIGLHHWGHRKDGRTNIVENATQPPS